MAHVLILLTAADSVRFNGGEVVLNGFWAQTFVLAHHLFLEHGHRVSVATHRGKPAVPDEHGFAPHYHDHDAGHILNLREQLDDIAAWRNPLSVERLALTGVKFEAMFFPDWQEPVLDPGHTEAVGTLIRRTLANRGLIGAIGCGSAALALAQREGRWLFADYSLTCTNGAGDDPTDMDTHLPQRLAGRLEQLGGRLSFAAAGLEHVVVDRQLFTGQNTTSAEKLVYLMARQLKKIRSLDKNTCVVPCD